MNLVVMSGKVFGDIFKDYEDDGKSSSVAKFTLENQTYSPKANKIYRTNIPVIATGALADYCYNEMYNGQEVIVTGRLLNKMFRVPDTGKMLNRLYMVCNTISPLIQNEYT